MIQKKRLVIFDLDNTILNGDSDYSMVNYLISKNILPESATEINSAYYQDYELGKLNFDDYTHFALSAYKGMSREQIDEIIHSFLNECIESMINIFALKLIHGHQSDNDELMLASATNELIVDVIGKRLGFNNIIATKVYFKDGFCMSKFIPPAALGHGKLELVEQWCKKEGYDLNDSVFYSDSINDLPLLSRVKKPVAVNPDALLEEKCLENGWEIINLPKI
tara:strand:+ start:4705 stop:5373 length:669 start_codon:yes stop_codon:yes gene_type:complete